MLYDDSFYEMINDGSYRSAKKVVPAFLRILAGAGIDKPDSVVDWGCGQGAWLRAFEEEGLSVRGFDGGYVDRQKLLINDDDFVAVDFANHEIRVLEGKYDVAISLEVAEHLPESRADVFVKMISDSADIVLFSAALPGQGGVGHVNEQWPDYWVQKFAANGFTHVSDALRWEFWNDPDVEPWYKQNLLVISKMDLYLPSSWKSVVHPIVWNHIRGV